jgi:hypothetical protein
MSAAYHGLSHIDIYQNFVKMSIANFANEPSSVCTAPLLDNSLMAPLEAVSRLCSTHVNVLTAAQINPADIADSDPS